MNVPNTNAGALRDLITWQQPTRTAGVTGQPVVSWSVVGTDRVHITATGGMQRTYGAQPVPQHDYQLTCRARTYAIGHDWRALWQDRKGVTRTLNVVVALPSETSSDWMIVLLLEAAPKTGAG